MLQEWNAFVVDAWQQHGAIHRASLEEIEDRHRYCLCLEEGFGSLQCGSGWERGRRLGGLLSPASAKSQTRHPFYILCF